MELYTIKGCFDCVWLNVCSYFITLFEEFIYSNLDLDDHFEVAMILKIFQKCMNL